MDLDPRQMTTTNSIRNDIVKRVRIADVIPLDTPLRLGVDVANGCNFKCSFCFHSIPNARLREMGFKPALMDSDTFSMVVEQCAQFPSRLKSFTFGGIGEPLLNKKISSMVTMVKKMDCAEKISMVTNASLLTPYLADLLIDAGLDEVIISVEALSSKKYEEITKRPINFETFLKSIEHLYGHRARCKIYAKAVDVSFESKDDRETFHALFDGISDLAYVETVVPRYKNVEYDGGTYTQENIALRPGLKADICSLPFYSLSVLATGNVCPCCVDYGETLSLGNVREFSLHEMWHGEQLRKFRLSLLRKDPVGGVCAGCKFTQHNGRAEDVIDDDAERLIDIFSNPQH